MKQKCNKHTNTEPLYSLPASRIATMHISVREKGLQL
jgi:hypothetical protein